MKFSCILSLFGINACSTQAPPPQAVGSEKITPEALRERVRSSPQPAVLFVGNSYSFGIPSAFSRLAADHGKSVRTGHSTYGGWRLAQHATHQPTLNKIRDGRWDIVVLQEHSEVPALPPRKRDAAMLPPIRILTDEVRKAGAIPVLYQTWGRRDGDSNRRGDDFHAMTVRLRDGYQVAASHAGGIPIVPVGDAWELGMIDGNGRTFYLEDGSHPSTAGNAVTARAFFEAFFGPQGSEQIAGE